MARAKEFFPPDLTNILETVALEQKWTKKEAEAARAWYERFLMLQWADPANDIVVIDRKADLLWHMHIVYTLRYRVYCESCLGYFLDHIPLDRPRKPTKAELDAADVAYRRWTKGSAAGTKRFAAGKKGSAAGSGGGGGGGGASPDSVTRCTTKPVTDPTG